MKSKLLLGLRILLSVVVLAAAGSRSDGLSLAVQQIRIMGARQWLGLMAGSIVASVPVIAPLSDRIAGSLPTEPYLPIAVPEATCPTYEERCRSTKTH